MIYILFQYNTRDSSRHHLIVLFAGIIAECGKFECKYWKLPASIVS